jgi:hypothetical protein
MRHMGDNLHRNQYPIHFRSEYRRYKMMERPYRTIVLGL